MLELEFARDVVVTGAIFGAAAFVWAGWAQERPPRGVIWRIVLVVLQIAGLVLLGFAVPGAVRHWNWPTAMDPGSAAFVWYVVVFWLEVLAIIVLAILLIRTRRAYLIAPAVLVIVGVHFVPLAFVFGQPLILIAALLITAAGAAALFLPRTSVAPSFWCGILAAPIFLILGTVALVAGIPALGP
ncbi:MULTISPECIES: hypothetical protein [unclassified Microbacterium]|uniref:hypothetical protein n=1 Tax=unclassified Microbacterium TaxID=2609290 RepID=UPI00214BC0AB|nr:MULTISPECIES: hypothetical protein [unclassified Microbacterium]MCR2808239.1 hypothetical protein [Microbacterium sp. zg.B185]WIM19305.1 hypothetical protein QNO12_00350 [Microbacterium sp. zg-B185]